MVHSEMYMQFSHCIYLRHNGNVRSVRKTDISPSAV